ncbi:MAG: hypothetical protein IJM90_06740 [Firmicutes bacterium]|nr:hypothetical protein [Bacillota bacterium]
MLLEQIGTMPEKEQVLHDLDMPRLMERISPEMTEEKALDYLRTYLCSDPAEIRERSLLLEELQEHSSVGELEKLSRQIAGLAEERLKWEQSESRLQQLLYTGRRQELYAACLEGLYSLASRGYTSGRMQRLLDRVGEMRRRPEYQRLGKVLDDYHELIRYPQSVTLAINTLEDARPQEIGLLSVQEERAEMHPVVDMRDAEAPADTLFPEMPYSRYQYGSHFDEYISRAVEKLWRGKINKAMDLFKRMPDPDEESLEGLDRELQYCAEGLRVIRFFSEKGFTLCRPAIAEDPSVLMSAESMIYPELAAKKEDIKPNPVKLMSGGAVIVTGANHSGKTSYLKTLAQNLLMAQMGYKVPAAEMAFRPVRHVFTLFSAGEDRDMSASRMGIEIRILAEILEQATSDDLVLINEPLTSTNPVEAISICADLVRKFLENRVTCMMVTHLYDIYFLLQSDLPEPLAAKLKSLVAEADFREEGMVYAYHFAEREPLGNSYAMETAKAFGITLEQLVTVPDLRKSVGEYCDDQNRKQLYRREEAAE